MRFMIAPAMSPSRFLDFLRRPSKGRRMQVFLIVDNLRAHHSRKVTAGIANNASKIDSSSFYRTPRTNRTST